MPRPSCPSEWGLLIVAISDWERIRAKDAEALLGRSGPLLADFVAEVSDYYARGLPRFVDTSSYYAAFGER